MKNKLRRELGLHYLHLTKPENVDSILKEGLRSDGNGPLGKGLYLLRLFDANSLDNLYSLLADYFDKYDKIAAVVGFKFGDFEYRDDDANIEGYYLSKVDLPVSTFTNIQIMNENQFRASFIEPIIVRFIVEFGSVEGLSYSFLHEFRHLGETPKEIAAILKENPRIASQFGKYEREIIYSVANSSLEKHGGVK